jgi:hypothetical protein
MAVSYDSLFHLQGPPKFTQMKNFGLLTNHLATLVATVFYLN